METKIKKWGNSAGVIVPANFLAELDLSVGSLVSMFVADGSIRIEPVTPDYSAQCCNCWETVNSNAELEYQEDEVFHCRNCGGSTFDLKMVKDGKIYSTEAAIIRKFEGKGVGK